MIGSPASPLGGRPHRFLLCFTSRRHLKHHSLRLIQRFRHLLPRTRGEVKYGVGLSLNAGLVEELLFRLGMPALLFGILHNGALAFLVASLLFGLLHIYQKVWGVLGATILGLVFSAVYLLTGSIWVVIVFLSRR